MTSKDVVYHFFGSNNEISRAIQRKLSKDVTKAKFIKHDRKTFEAMLVGDYLGDFNPEKEYFHKIIYSWGLLYSKRLSHQSYREACQSYAWNFLLPMKILEILNLRMLDFRFVFISSESARKGSFDANYAAQKAASERFIRECRLTNPLSSAVCIAPSMIADSGMTMRRADIEVVQRAASENPKQRLLTSQEVCDLVCWIIDSSSSYLTNTTIEINGGKFSRMIYK